MRIPKKIKTKRYLQNVIHQSVHEEQDEDKEDQESVGDEHKAASTGDVGLPVQQSTAKTKPKCKPPGLGQFSGADGGKCESPRENPAKVARRGVKRKNTDRY